MSLNNNFANRTFLAGLPVSITGSNIGDTGEVGEPAQSGVINSTWWSWTAPSTGTVTFDTIGSNFDTYLSLFSGSAVNNLSLIQAHDDIATDNRASKITRTVTAGTTYQIAVDGYSDYTGSIKLNISAPPPPNNNFANRIALTGATTNGTGSNHGATPEVGEPTQSGQINSSWWSWTAPSSGFFKIDTIGSNHDTYLSLFTGPAVNNLTLIGANDDIGGGNYASLYNLNATAGTTYQIAVDGYLYNTLGSISLNIAPIAPPNDNFANRFFLSGQTASATGSNIRATGEVGESAQSGPTNSVWWSWTAPSSGNYTFNTIGSNFDTYLSLFSGSAVNSLSLIQANDDIASDNRASRVNRFVTAGTTYQIAVDGFDANIVGQIKLNIAPIPAGAAILTEPGNADTINAVPETIADKPANNTVNGETAEDSLTGDPGADTLILPFPESSVSPSDPGTEFADSKKIGDILTEGGVLSDPPSLFTPAAHDDILTEGGVLSDPPSLFSPAANTDVSTLEKDVNPGWTDAKGALAGNPGLGINGDLFGVDKNSLFPDSSLVGNYPAQPLGLLVA